MTLLELTLMLGLGVAIAFSTVVQGNVQLQTLKLYKIVEYYSKEVPRMASALHNMTRTAHTFKIYNISASTQTTAGYPVPAPPSGSEVTSGNALLMQGTSRSTSSSSIMATPLTNTAVIWMAPIQYNAVNAQSIRRADADGSGIKNNGHVDFSLNKYDLLAAAWNSSTPKPPVGWALCKNISGVTFTILPNHNGLVLMQVFRQEKSGSAPSLVFDLVLERK